MTSITRNASVAVTNAITEVSTSKPASERVDLVLRNLDAAITISVTISDSEGAVANTGIILRPYDGIALSKSQGYIVPQGAVSAIGSAAGPATLAVFERYM